MSVKDIKNLVEESNPLLKLSEIQGVVDGTVSDNDSSDDETGEVVSSSLLLQSAKDADASDTADVKTKTYTAKAVVLGSTSADNVTIVHSSKQKVITKGLSGDLAAAAVAQVYDNSGNQDDGGEGDVDVDDDGLHTACAANATASTAAPAAITLSDLLEGYSGDEYTFTSASFALKTKSTGVTTAKFQGLLNMDTTPLSLFREQFNLSRSGVFMDASISISEGTNVSSKKLDCQEIKICSEPVFNATLGDGLCITDVRFALGATRKESGAWDSSFATTGTLKMNFSEDETPTMLTASMAYDGGVLSLAASGTDVVVDLGNDIEVVFNSFAVKGSIDANGDAGCSLSAQLALSAGTLLDFGGKLVAGTADFGMYCKVTDLSLATISDVYQKVTGADKGLKFPKVLQGCTIDSLLVTFATEEMEVDTGLSLVKGAALDCDMTIGGFKVRVKGLVTEDEVAFEGSVLDGDFSKMGPIGKQIKVDELTVTFAMSSKSDDMEVMFYGDVQVFGIDLQACVLFEKTDGDSNVVIHATATPANYSDNGFSLGDLHKPLEGTFADSISFSELSFTYAQNVVESSTIKGLEGKRLEAGFSVGAVCGEIQALSDLLGSKQDGLKLEAFFPSDVSAGPEITIALPSSATINLGNGVTMGPPFIEINTAPPRPSFKIVFVMFVKVPKQKEKLEFQVGMEIDPIGAKASGLMKGFWEQPFQVKGLRIGPECLVEIGIIYATFSATGCPSSFAMKGGVQLGKIGGEMGFRISQDPLEQVLMGRLYTVQDSTSQGAVAATAGSDVAPITPEDLLSAIEAMTGTKLGSGKVPDFFEIYDLDLMVASSAGTLGTVAYKQGVTFNCVMKLFGVNAEVHAEISETGTSMIGAIDPFEIGPLQVYGAKGDRIRLEYELTKTSQSMLIDCAAELFGAEVSLYLMIAGKNDMYFEFTLAFGAALSFEVIGSKNPEGFYLRAEMQSDVVGYVVAQIMSGLKKSIDAVGSAQDDLDKKEAAFRAKFDPLERELNRTKQAALNHKKKLNADLKKANELLEKGVATAKAALESATKAYEAACQKAKEALAKAKAKYEAEFKKAEAAVAKARAKYNDDIKKSKENLRKADEKMKHEVAKATAKISSAQRDCDNMRSKYEKAKKKLKKCKVWKKAKYAAKVASYWTAYNATKRVLDAAKKVMSAGAAAAAKVAFEAAKSSLHVAQYGGNRAVMQVAESTLAAVRKGSSKAAFDSAQKAVSGLGNLSDFVDHKIAKAALAEAEKLGKKLINQARSALNAFATCALQVAFVAAQAALDACEESTVAVSFKVAKSSLKLYEKGATAVATLAENCAGEMFDIQSFVMEADMKTEGPSQFDVKLKLIVFGKKQKLGLTFQPGNVTGLIDSLLDEVCDSACKMV